jgi:TolA-binding protein
MSFQKRKSNQILEQAEMRAASLKAIDPNLDFGNNRSITKLDKQIEDLQDSINLYNTAITNLGNLRSQIKEQEKELRNLTTQMLLGVAFTYGKDSFEYEMAGGVRKSERSRRISAGLTRRTEAEAEVEVSQA